MNMHHKAPNFKNPSALIAACVIRGGSFHGQFPAEKDRRVLLASHELGLNGAPIVLLYLARSLRRPGWQPVLIAPVAGPLLDTLVRESFPVLICPKVTENNVLLRSAGLFRFVVLNTLVFAKAAAALNGSDTRVLWWVHEAEDTAAMRERARSFYLSIFSIASFDRRLETEILPELLGGKPQTQPLHPAETPKQITKPLGSVLEVISWAIQPHAEKGLLRKGLYSLRTNGPRVTWQKAMQKIYFSENYRQVAKQELFTEEELARQRKHHFTKEVKFSIVVPLYNTTERFLRDMIESVQAQTYAGWELCMADGSDAQHGDVQRICREYVRRDKRIRYRKLEKNLGISGNTNACLEMATGDYIGLFDHDDLLHPAALYEVMCAIESTSADFIYTDECTFHDTPKDAYMPHFKPDFAPDNLRTNNYICHFTVFKRSLLDEVGLFDPTCDGSQDHDMALRLTEKARRVAHIPEILYYWRAHAGSVAESPGEKPYVIDAGIRAVEKQLDRLGLDGKVEPVRPGMTFYRTRYTIKGTPKVSILIPNYEHIDDLRTCLNSIFHKTTWPNYEIVIVENNSTSRELFAYYESIQREHANVFVVTWEGKFNYSAINNFGAQFCTGEYLLVLLVFCICLTGALLLPISQCPDEPGRRLISDWIIRTGTLPTGDEPATQLMLWADLNAPVLTVSDDSGYNGWGFSYALRPFLSSIVGAAFERIARCFTDSPRILLAASRMCSVLSVTLCCFFCLRLGHRLFDKQGAAALFAALVCFLPQVQFLGMYQNNDSLSLCAVSMMLYYLIEGFDLGWPVRSCVGLGISFSIGLLAYYSVCGWLLMGVAFCVLAVLTDPGIPNKGRLLSVRLGLVLGICLLLAGWFFVRNACLHHGDFLGIASEKISRAHMQEQGYVLYKYICYRDEGMSAAQFLRFKDYEWLRMTIESFIGVFGYMLIYLPKIQYGIYYTVFFGAIILFFIFLLHQKVVRRDKLLMLMMLFSSIITVFLHFWQSYARDYQPQGRYIITLILPLAFMLAYGVDKTTVTVQNARPGKSAELNPAAALTVLWLVLFAWAALGTMSKMLP